MIDPEPYLPLVRAIAGRMYRRLRLIAPLLEYGDLIGYGTIGLMQACARYDGRPGNTFRTFAGWRIWGAIKDGLQDWDHLTRWQRAEVRRGIREAPVHVWIGEVEEGELEWAIKGGWTC